MPQCKKMLSDFDIAQCAGAPAYLYSKGINFLHLNNFVEPLQKYTAVKTFRTLSSQLLSGGRQQVHAYILYYLRHKFFE